MMTPELEDLFTLLRFPSVSTDSVHRADTRACAGWLVTKLLGMGMKTTLHETPGHPVIVAQNEHRPGRRTVLLYGHYDVQPAEPVGEWRTPPLRAHAGGGPDHVPGRDGQQRAVDGPRLRIGKDPAGAG